jgi:phosphoribulokinase
VKETTPSGYLGSIEMKGKIVHQFESPKQNNEVEDTIQNGVKYTYSCPYNDPTIVEDTIQNGVKYTTVPSGTYHWRLEDTIQNGVKHTEYGDWLDGDERLDEIIQNGIKETHWKRVDNHPTFVDRIIEIINPS